MKYLGDKHTFSDKSVLDACLFDGDDGGSWLEITVISDANGFYETKEVIWFSLDDIKFMAESMGLKVESQD